MGDKFANYPQLYYNSASVYYRLELSNLILDFDKIIYLDIDTIVHKDLTELFNIDIGKYYFLGFPALDLTIYQFRGTRNYISSGVMLINLKKLREVNAPKLFKDYYMKYGTKKVDEYLINAVFYDKISFLPLIYGIPDFGTGNSFTISPELFLNRFKNFTNFTSFDMKNASKFRAITHNCYEIKKWWNRKYDNLTIIGKQWLFYAAKSNIFNNICKKYIQFQYYCWKIKNRKI